MNGLKSTVWDVPSLKKMRRVTSPTYSARIMWILLCIYFILVNTCKYNEFSVIFKNTTLRGVHIDCGGLVLLKFCQLLPLLG